MATAMTKATPGYGASSSLPRLTRTKTVFKCYSTGKVQAGSVRMAADTEARKCSKRQMLLGGAILLLAPLLAQPASAKAIQVSAADNSAPSFNGFDGVGGADADYANAEVWMHLTFLKRTFMSKNSYPIFMRQRLLILTCPHQHSRNSNYEACILACDDPCSCMSAATGDCSWQWRWCG